MVECAVVHERLRMMRELLDDLDGIGEITADRLVEDCVIRHATERILTRLVDASVLINFDVATDVRNEVPSTDGESYAAAARVGLISGELAAQLRPSAALRKLLTYESVSVYPVIMARAATHARRTFRQYVTEAARFVSGAQ